MKKLVSILLLLGLCLGALASCGPEEEGTSGFDVFNAFNEEYAPTKITTRVDYVYTEADGTLRNLTGDYMTMIEGDKSIFAFSYERLATIEDMAPDRFVTVSGNIYKNGNQVSSDGDTWEDATALPGANFKLSVKAEYFASYELSNENNTLIGVVKPENVKDVFGVALSANGDVKLTVNGNGERVTGVEVTYKTASGATVSISTSYTYSAVTVTIPE